MLGSAKAETQLTIIEVTGHDLFLSPGVIPSHSPRLALNRPRFLNFTNFQKGNSKRNSNVKQQFSRKSSKLVCYEQTNQVTHRSLNNSIGILTSNVHSSGERTSPGLPVPLSQLSLTLFTFNIAQRHTLNSRKST